MTGRDVMSLDELLLGLVTASSADELATVGVRAIESGHLDTRLVCARCDTVGVRAVYPFPGMVQHVRVAEAHAAADRDSTATAAPVTALHGTGDIAPVVPS